MKDRPSYLKAAITNAAACLLLVCLSCATPNQEQVYSFDDVQGVAEVYYQPPIVPLEFSVNSQGEANLRFIPQMTTPIGTFGLGIGASRIKRDKNTYFILRNKEKESVFCIGASGKLRLRTKGESVVEIGPADGYSNAFIIEATAVAGEFSAEFVPDPDNPELARIRMGIFDHLVLSKDGSIIVDQSSDTVIPLKGVDEVVLAETYGRLSTLVYFFTTSDGKKHYHRWLLDEDDTLEARWFIYCLQMIAPEKISQIHKVVNLDESSNYIYSDGSILSGILFVPARTIDRIEISREDPMSVVLKYDPQYPQLFAEMPLGFQSRARAEEFARAARQQLQSARIAAIFRQIKSMKAERSY